jgi:non-ribosomal peptide synthetase component F
MNLLGALNVLLFKYSGQGDLIVGVGTAGRPYPQLKNILGMFVNTLAIRNSLGGEKTYCSFLKEVKENCLNAFKNQDVQFEWLINRLKLQKDPAHNPLFDVLFVVQNYETSSTDSLEGTGFVTSHDYDTQNSKFDITLYAHEVNDVILFGIEYSTHLFKPSTIEKMAERYLEIIKQVVEDKNIRLKDIVLSHRLYDQKLELPPEESEEFGF